ncbi:insulin-like growth factor-binding protein complex acid labile subunit [Macrosteles quadrilineatus]|uniref:insulin-like growth factor-binding protein complex acid labile subunit n=1 Tax=Macrosteles quadrilineatus TaxID=74068 RepID=UPI0023E0EA70|nr:insulin-like growth factor-binding protein complex acid labile subunit [Macrosteles quadrilineatus]
MARLVMVYACVAMLTSSVTSVAFCPQGCTCDDETLVVSCIEANLDVIPITLNPAIQRLVLKYNRVKAVDAAFQFYGELQFVDLSHNHLVSLSTKSFEAQKKLVEFHLNHNRMSQISNTTFLGLKSLKVLSLRGNFLEDLPDKLFSVLSLLEELDLGQNRIMRIDSTAFAGLPNLRILSLDDNMLKTVPTPTFPYLASLAELHVGLNVFTALSDDAFKGLSKLSVLDVSDASLVNISENAFRGLGSLRKLVLTGNRLISIPTKQMSSLTRVEELSIGQNEFRSIEHHAFQGLQNLRQLEINGAPALERIAKGCLSDNLNLESITISNNKRLTTIEDGAFAGLPNLRHLVLRDNAFTTFSESSVAWPELRKIDVSENPLTCNCNLRWLKELLITRNTSQVLCASPGHLKNKPLKSLTPDDLGCALHDTRKQVIIGAVCATAAFFAAAVGFMIYRYRRTMQSALKNVKWEKPKISKECQYQKTCTGDEDYRNTQPYKHEPTTEL